MENKAKVRAKALVHVVAVILLGLVSCYTHVRPMGDWGPLADMKYCAADSTCCTRLPDYAAVVASRMGSPGSSPRSALLSMGLIIAALAIGTLVPLPLWLPISLGLLGAVHLVQRLSESGYLW
jgi:hypothetical protein